MAKKALTDEELFAQFEGIGGDDTTAAPPASAPESASTSTSKPTQSDTPLENDPLTELANLAKAKPSSRPNTPKFNNRNRSPKRPGAATPSSTGSTRTSEERAANPTVPRKSGESTRSYHQAFTPASSEEREEPEPEKKVLQAPPAPEPQKQSSGGGWWGGIFATASAAVKQAEAAVKEIQKNEEAQRWAEQVKGNAKALKGIGDQLRSQALPTFTSLLHTLAPPISQHERLQIHTTHDLLNYPSLDPLIYQTFSRVMAQVEGGDLMVIQRGSESSFRRNSQPTGYTGGGLTGSSSGGWTDGPWWRQQGDARRDIGAVRGLMEGTKLARASAEAYAAEFFGARGGVEEAARAATEGLSDSNPVRSSDIFLAIQPMTYPAPEELFGGKGGEEEEGEGKEDEVVAFAVYLHDPIHSISFRTVSQAVPARWTRWLDAEGGADRLPDEIREIVQGGGVDPREWVAEWIEEVIGLAVGVVAQRYVAKRMGVGEGSLGKGKMREDVVESGGGEAARAI